MSVRPLLELIPNWEAFVGVADAPNLGELLHAHAGPGRTLGPDACVESLELRLRHPLKRRKPGAKPQARDRNTWDLFDIKPQSS